ncbi:glycosyltransferase family 2 protein [Amycolatopsis sp. YIM 10]|uniref:glycosyltransferase family 2 protein n=1 Tax=Amycolatopsis sp. YIM 10 TaxID=2653857 RepID=UPI0012A82587|nr:glycosyltransferase family 2 protein [Amycolatopsis sp. YIM 10]QFU86309.1 N-acetylglucosaminyl-diphospho-decaprenol L-rhamnosyltransferase [Amycolatopsis sp. YIM 10]
MPSFATVPVLAVLVCHNGEAWLPLALSALRRSGPRPRHVLAVDTGSTDRTPALLAEAADPEAAVGGEGPILDGILTLTGETGFAEAVSAAVSHATERWGDPGSWIWLLHDDCAPEPDCLDRLLRAAETSPSAGVLGPISVDWTDPRLITEAGLSTDASGHRQSVAGELENRPEQSTEVLAVPSAGVLVRRELWTELGGFDPEIPLLREDIDFGWRANAAGSVVLSVPTARMRHVRALATGQRTAHAVPDGLTAADRALGLRTFLVNCSAPSFWWGLPRLLLLCLLRGLGFALLRRGNRAAAEFRAIGYLAGGRAGLRAARRKRAAHRGSVRGLLIGRFVRLRNATRALVLSLIRRRVASEAALGRLPETTAAETAWIPPEAMGGATGGRRPVGPDALPAGVRSSGRSLVSGLRRPAGVVAVELPDEPAAEPERPRPSPGPREVPRELVFVEVNRKRILAATVFSPPVVLFVVLTAIALVTNSGRLGFDLAGGHLLPVGGLGQLWSDYLASWHAVGGGTAAAAPPTLAVLGLLGAVFQPIGGPATLVALVLLLQAPIAALLAYAVTRRLRVHRWVRAAVAAGYGLLPAATAGAAQGRFDVVAAHLLLPVVLAGIVAVLTAERRKWLHTSVLCALGLALFGAFTPLGHALALVGLVVAFVVLPAPGLLLRRAASVVIVVFLPLLLLLPWPAVLVRYPKFLLHGLGAPGGAQPGAGELFGLAPGGPGAWPVGVVVLAAALMALILRPTARAVPGLLLALLGAAGVVLVRSVEVADTPGGVLTPGFAGVPLLVAGAGLLWAVLAACERTTTPSAAWLPKAAAIGGVVLLAVLATGALVAGRDGPLTADGGLRLADPLTNELAQTQRSVLVLAGGGEPARQASGRLPSYGDDDLVPTTGARERLADWQVNLLSGVREPVQEALAGMAADGVLFVVLPPGVDSAPIQAIAEEQVAAAPPAADGRQVLRLTTVGGPVVLISPELAQRAVNGRPPEIQSADASVAGTAVVEAVPPEVRVRVSDGPAGRLLVLAADEEPGWKATVNGERAAIVRAWGHQVAVAVPTRQAEVVVEYSGGGRNILLLVQVAALLFAALTAVPSRRGHSPSITSGSTPR